MTIPPRKPGPKLPPAYTGHDPARARQAEYERRKSCLSEWQRGCTPEQWEAACKRIAAELGL